MKSVLFGLLIFLLFPFSVRAAEAPAVIISEIAWMGSLSSANHEWIELHNTTENDIDISGWTLNASDGSPSISLEGVIPAQGYFLLERTTDNSAPDATADQIYTGTLSNNGERLLLTNNTGSAIDSIDALQGWPAGDNETKQTLQRTTELSWQTSTGAGGTPKAANPTNENEQEDENQQDTEQTETTNTNINENMSSEQNTPAKKNSIIINEVLPNPLGDDSLNEFIELKNVNSYGVNLNGWTLKTKYYSYEIPSIVMYPNSIVVFYRAKTMLPLHNEKDTVQLKSANGTIIDELKYSETKTGLSLQKDTDERLHTLSPTPGEENIIALKILPEIVLYGPTKVIVGEIVEFDASDSFDPKQRELSFTWNFGDGRTDSGTIARQLYTTAGNYELVLTATAGNSAQATSTLKITVAANKEPVNSDKEKNATSTPAATAQASTQLDAPKTELQNYPYIFISEFLPNPEGSDTENEFIELYSGESYPINLKGYQLADGAGKYTFKTDAIIKPSQYLALMRKEIKIALNNDRDEIKLIAPDGTIMDYVTYDKPLEGNSFILNDSMQWEMTNTPTPGEINIASNIKDEPQELEPAIASGVLGQKVTTEQPTEPSQNINRMWYAIIAASFVVILFVVSLVNKKKLQKKFSK